ncbi:MAG: DNA cytosine methyltransferase [Bacilli bacterium]|nr:DNA cytosine methyltransferase [Bacilli bacterium]
MPSYIDLFAGCGGLSLGLKNAGWTGLFAIEKNKDAFNTFEYNLLDNHSHFEWPEWLPKTNHDIYEVLKRYRNELIKLNGKVDLVVGGPPCQGFSLAGKRNEEDKRNELVDAYIKFVEIVKPKMVFFENVHGFTIPFDEDKIPFSVIVKRKLSDLGYKLVDQVVDVSKLGVPQKRKRFILVGSLNNDVSDFFDLLFKNSEAFLNNKGLKRTVTIDEAISDLLKKNGVYKSKDYKNFEFGMYGKHTSNYEKYMSKNGGIYPDSHRFANHKKETIDLFEYLGSLSNDVIRMSPKKDQSGRLRKRSVTILKSGVICGTVTSIPDDYIHYSEPRIMTVREMARIQSFPDDFKFFGKYTTGGLERRKDVPRYTQIANAVPPLFAEQVGITLKTAL